MMCVKQAVPGPWPQSGEVTAGRSAVAGWAGKGDRLGVVWTWRAVMKILFFMVDHAVSLPLRSAMKRRNSSAGSGLEK